MSSPPEVMMSRLDDLDRDVRARIAEAEERVRSGAQATSSELTGARELGKWIEQLKAYLEEVEESSPVETSGLGARTDQASGG
jgi:hypothetical protein